MSYIDMFAKELGLKYAVFSIPGITTLEALDKVVCNQDAFVKNPGNWNFGGVEVDAPVTYRKVVYAFDKILEQIDGETNHIFLEGIEVRLSLKEGARAEIRVFTGS